MKTKNFLSFAALALLALVFQGCPGSYTSPERETDAFAFVYSPRDSVYARYYTLQNGNRQLHEEVLTPTRAAEVVSWYGGYYNNGLTEYDNEYQYLHIRKLSNIASSYVLRSQYVKLNGHGLAWNNFPSKYYNKDGASSLPFIEQVIDTLLIYYPDAVIPITDMEEHGIYSNKTYLAPPSISIDY